MTRHCGFRAWRVTAARASLTDIKAVAPGYPLRGEVRLADTLFGARTRRARGAGAGNGVGRDDRLLTRLNVKPGDMVAVGRLQLRIAALVTQEPDSVIGFINSAPRVLMNEADIGATGLLQAGSRVRYRLYIAGETPAVDAYRAWAQTRIGGGQSIEGIRDARPEIRSALERAERFLGLAALVSVILSAVAIALAARRFLRRHLDGSAVMRCIGARQAIVVRLYLLHFIALGTVAGIAGCLIGYAAQFALAAWLGGFLAVALPWPKSGACVLLASPPACCCCSGSRSRCGFVSLGQVSTLRVLRRDLGLPRGMGAAGYALGTRGHFWRNWCCGKRAGLLVGRYDVLGRLCSPRRPFRSC